jgi:hypothetical protein
MYTYMHTYMHTYIYQISVIEVADAVGFVVACGEACARVHICMHTYIYQISVIKVADVEGFVVVCGEALADVVTFREVSTLKRVRYHADAAGL